MTISSQTPLSNWVSRNLQLYGPGGMGGGTQWAGDYDPNMGLGYSPTVGWNAFEAAGRPGGNWDSWVGDQYLKSRGMTGQQFASSQPNIKYDAATNTVTDVSNDDQQSGLNGFWTGPGIIASAVGGLAAGGLAAGSTAAGGGTTAAGTADTAWGVNPVGGNVADTTYDFWDFNSPNGGSLMPAATPESTAQLTDWGMTETAPGVWSQPAAGTPADSIWKSIQQATGLAPRDALNLVGKLGAAGIQAYSSDKQAGALQALADRYRTEGAPSRARFEASMTPGFDPMSIPGYAGTLDSVSKSVLAKLSATGGNPFGNPGGLIDANKQIVAGTALPALQEYQRLNLAGGGQASLNAAIPNIETGAITAGSGVPAAIAAGVGSATAPDNSLAGLLAQLKAAGYDFGSTGGLKLANGLGF